MTILDQAKQDIANANLEQAIKRLLSISLPLFYEEQIISVSSRYHQLKVSMIKGLVRTEEIQLETNRISFSALSIVNELIDKGVDFKIHSDNEGEKMSSEIMQVAERLYDAKGEVQQPVEAIREDGKAVLTKIEETIQLIINDMEEKGVSYANQGKIMAIAENLNNILNGKVDAGVIDNLSASINHAKYSRALVFNDVSKKQEALFALEMAKGYLSALIGVS